MNIYSYSNYREFLQKTIESQKKLDSSRNFQTLATAMRLQKSYLSKVIKGDADLNSDQLYLACEYLGVGAEATDYLLLLLEHARCVVTKRREALDRRIRKIQNEKLQTDSHISAKAATGDTFSDYYLNPILLVVHMSMFIERYRKNASLLAKDLGIPLARITDAILKLQELGVLKYERETYTVLIDHIHLPANSPLYPAWRAQLRLLSQQKLQVSSTEDAYSFSVAFSADEATRKHIQKKFLDLIREIEPNVRDASSDQVYQMNFDLLRWT